MSIQKSVKILVGLAILAVAGIFLFTNKSKPENQNEKTKPLAASKAWIEVLKPAVLVTKANGSTASLQTGDEVETGDTVKTDANGLANIYFPDGSVIRLDVATDLKIVEAEYDMQNQKLVVKVFVNLGRVWSKIVKLSTPDSVWEVNTANAVATVRGTAFGVEFAGGETAVIGSENNVGVRLRDPQTKVLSKEEIVVSPNKILRTSDIISIDVVAGKVTLGRFLYSAPASVLNQTWIKRARASDLQLDVILNSDAKTTEELKQTILESSPSLEPATGASVNTTVKPTAEIRTTAGTITISTTNDFIISSPTASDQELNQPIR